MVRKFLLAFLIVTEFAVAGKNPFSTVRTLSFDESGNPLEEAIDLVVCLERNPVVGNPSDINSRERYENIIKYWADGIYEMSNGGNYLGKIKIFSGGMAPVTCDVVWKKEGVWPHSFYGHFNQDDELRLNVSDEWAEPQKWDYRDTPEHQFQFGMTLTHESMHYIYGLRDEYGTISFDPDDGGFLTIYADPTNDIVSISILGNHDLEKSWLDAIINGQYVAFVASETGTLPKGLDSYLYSGYRPQNYLIGYL